MVSVSVVETIEEKYAALRDVLDERSRRLWAASEASALGHGGVAAVARATGLAESTIRAGRRELREGVSSTKTRISRMLWPERSKSGPAARTTERASQPSSSTVKRLGRSASSGALGREAVGLFVGHFAVIRYTSIGGRF